jgi:sulfoxide reductase heme-binding subunit YedZ
MMFSWSQLFKPVLFLLALVPFLFLLYAALMDPDILGANPVEYLTHETGAWSLRFLLLTLLMTPLRRYTGWSYPLRVRRMLGLFAFFYVTLHFFIYAGLDLGLDVSHLSEDILDRPYITIGFLAWLLLIPLAFTSTKAMMRRLGRRWKKLHSLVYLIGLLGVVHFIWLIKKDLQEPLIYAAIFIALMITRIPLKILKSKVSRFKDRQGSANSTLKDSIG